MCGRQPNSSSIITPRCQCSWTCLIRLSLRLRLKWNGRILCFPLKQVAYFLILQDLNSWHYRCVGVAERVKGHPPDRLQVYSSSAGFRPFLSMWWLCDCDFGVATSSCMELPFGGSSAFLSISECCCFAFCFLQRFVYWTVSVSYSVHKLPVSCTCKAAFKGDTCLPSGSDPGLCS